MVKRPRTRAADKLLIINAPRPPSLLHILGFAMSLPFTPMPVLHDAFISLLRAYSPSAFQALARYADPAVTLELRRGTFGGQIVLASRLHNRRYACREMDGRVPSTRFTDVLLDERISAARETATRIDPDGRLV